MKTSHLLSKLHLWLSSLHINPFSPFFFIYALRFLLQFLCSHTTYYNSCITKDPFEGDSIRLRSKQGFQTLELDRVAWSSKSVKDDTDEFPALQRQTIRAESSRCPRERGKDQRRRRGREEETSSHKSLLNLERMESVVCSVIYQDSVLDITAE